MKIIMKNILLLACLFMVLLTDAQEVGTVEFLIQPQNSTIKIDGKLLDYSKKESRSIALSPGIYTLEIWAPCMAIYTDTIEVVANETKRYIKGLNKTSEHYQAYLAERKKYFWKKTVGHTADVAILSADIALALFFFKKNDNLSRAYDNALLAAEVYESTDVIGELEDKRNSYEALREKYYDLEDKHNRKLAIGIPVISVATGLTVWYFIKRLSKKRKKPIFIDSNPFISLQPSLGNSSSSNSQTVIGLTIKF